MEVWDSQGIRSPPGLCLFCFQSGWLLQYPAINTETRSAVGNVTEEIS